METTTEDVKTTTVSSSVEDMDDTNSSPSSQEHKLTPEEQAKGFAEAVAKGIAKVKGTEEKPASDKGEESDSSKEPEDDDEAEETSKDPSEKEEEETKDEPKVEEEVEGETKTIPYDRFREVNTAKNKAEQTLKEYEPYVQAQQSIANYCDQHNITGEDYKFGLSLMSALKNDPMKAMEMLKPHLSQLQQLNGEVLPEDLQKAVADGGMTEEWAKALAQERAKNNFSQRQVEKSKEQVRAERYQAEFRQAQQTVNSWIDSKKKSDPDFKPSTDGLDGPMEDFWMKLNTEGAQAQIKDMAGLTILMEKIYKSVKDKYARFQPKSNGTKHVRTNTTTSTNRGEPKTLEEAVALGARKSGVNWTPPKR